MSIQVFEIHYVALKFIVHQNVIRLSERTLFGDFFLVHVTSTFKLCQELMRFSRTNVTLADLFNSGLKFPGELSSTVTLSTTHDGYPIRIPFADNALYRVRYRVRAFESSFPRDNSQNIRQ